jgi:hypothetical protein
MALAMQKPAAKWLFLLLSLPLALYACGGATNSRPEESDAGSASDAQSDTDARASDDGSTCPTNDDSFRACATADDCTLASLAQCTCGSPAVIVGVARVSHDEYERCSKEALARSLAASGTACGGCAAKPECIADDGKTANCSTGLSALGVTCVAGRCASFVSPDGSE